MSRYSRLAPRVDQAHRDMHYHCDSCGSVSPTPGKCQDTKCELYGEWRTLCRKVGCAPKE